METLFARAIANAIIPDLLGTLLLQFSRTTASNICYLAKNATRAISRDSKRATFFERTIAHANILAHMGALLLLFSHAIASNIRYLA